MIKSMTGYGKAEAVLETGKLTIEIKTLNGKNSDANIKSSLLPKDKELLVRRKLTDSLVRGTIDFYVNWEPKAGGMAKQINKELLREYYDQLMDFSASLPVFDSLSFNPNEMLASILRFPDVMDNSRQDIITEENWPVVEKAIDEALAAVNDYRAKEGEALYKDVTSRVRNILDLENQVEGFEKERIDAVREKLMKNFEERKYRAGSFLRFLAGSATSLPSAFKNERSSGRLSIFFPPFQNWVRRENSASRSKSPSTKPGISLIDLQRLRLSPVRISPASRSVYARSPVTISAAIP